MKIVDQELKTKLEEILEKEFSDESDFKYKTEFKENQYFKIYERSILKGNWNVSNLDVNWLFDWFQLHFEYSIFAQHKLKDDALAKHHLSLAIHYGAFCLDYGAQSCSCIKPAPFVIMNKATFILSLLLITNDEKSFNRIGHHLIDSVNSENCIIKIGYSKATIAWFLLELFSSYSEKEITLNKLFKSKPIYPYNDIIQNWDTQDEQKIEKYIHLLCDAHNAQADIDHITHREEDFDSLKYRELFIVSMYFIPFEVIVLLKLRKLKGLNNPEEFNHPLMNTAIAKIFLEIKDPLTKPEILPYAKELLSKLKEKCPSIEIPY